MNKKTKTKNCPVERIVVVRWLYRRARSLWTKNYFSLSYYLKLLERERIHLLLSIMHHHHYPLVRCRLSFPLTHSLTRFTSLPPLFFFFLIPLFFILINLEFQSVRRRRRRRRRNFYYFSYRARSFYNLPIYDTNGKYN